MMDPSLDDLIQVREMVCLAELAYQIEPTEDALIMIRITQQIYATYLASYKIQRQEKRKQHLKKCRVTVSLSR